MKKKIIIAAIVVVIAAVLFFVLKSFLNYSKGVPLHRTQSSDGLVSATR